MRARMSRNSGNARALRRGRIGTNDIANEEPLDRSDRNPLRSTHAGAQPNKNWAFDNIAHADVGDSHIFEQRTIHTLQRYAATSIEHTIGDGNSLKAPIRFRAKLDSTGTRHSGFGRERLAGAVPGEVQQKLLACVVAPNVSSRSERNGHPSHQRKNQAISDQR